MKIDMYYLEHVMRILRELPKRQLAVIEMRYGLENGYIHTPEEVGRKLIMTRERVRQIEERVALKLSEIPALTTNP